MKFFSYLVIFFIGLPFVTQSQQYTYIKKPALGIHFLLNDFKSADYIRNASVGDAFKNGQFGNLKKMDAGIALSYQQGITSHLDFSATFSGSFLDYALHNGRVLGKNNLLLETDASVFAKMFNDKHLVDPYLQAGIGGSVYGIWYGLFTQLGTGVQVRLSNEAFLLINAQYRIGLTDFANDHFYYSIGVIGNLLGSKPKKRKTTSAHKAIPVAVNVPPKDSDGDGVPDSLDACPQVAGLKQYEGCPDTDQDGIPDHKDKCPTMAGSARYGGCPVPDTDGDGINDENDSCPTIAGPIKYHGCPVPDTDGDGVNDEEDKCITLPGLKENQGCPLVKKEITDKVNFYARHIYFETASYTLLPASFKPLDEVIKLLQADPNLKLAIEGHTDIIGNSESNQVLSENRAKAVLNYLVTKGNVDAARLSAAGFGISRPVADNKTAAGRTLNRRVELILKY